MEGLKRALRAVLGPSATYRIYTFDLERPPSGVSGDVDLRPLGRDDVATAEDAELRRTAVYAGEDAHGFGLWVGERLATACWYWSGERYRTERGFWPLEDREAKLVQITTGAAHRGRGAAPRVLRESAARMREIGFRRLYARIWHSNRPSIRAFEKAGWRYAALVVELSPPGRSRPLRFVRRRRPKGGAPLAV